MSSMLKIFFKNTFWTYILAYLAIPLGFLLKTYYARELSPTDFGLFYAVLGLFLLVLTFTDLGFTNTIPYFGTKFILTKG